MSAVDDFDSQYENVRDMVETYVADSQNFLNSIQHMVNISPYSEDPGNFTIPEIPNSPLSLGSVSPPDRRDVSEPSIPDAPASPDTNVDIDIEFPEPPQIDLISHMPEMPDISIPSGEPGEVPASPAVSLPEAPAPDFPDDPTLAPINLPSAPNLVFPTAPDTTLPSLDDYGLLDRPDATNIKNEIDNALADLELQIPEVSSAEWSELKDTLRSRGVALDQPVMPQNILDQVLDKEKEKFEETVLDKQEELLSLWSSRGFTMPLGIATRQARQITDELTTKRWDYERDVIHKEFDMTREDMKYYTSEYGKLLEFFLDARIRFIEALVKAKQGMYQLSLQTYQVAADLYKTAIEGIRMKVQIYSELMQAEKVKIDLYASEIEAEKAKSQINQQLIDLYRAKLAGIQTRYDAYAKEVEAQNAIVSLYRNQVEAYSATVQAYNLKFQIPELKTKIYLAQIQGVTAMTELVKSKVSIWEAELDGMLKKNQIKMQKIQASIDAYKLDVQETLAKIDVSKARMENNVAMARVDASNYQQTVAQYRANVEAMVAEATSAREYLKLRLQSLVEKAKLQERQFEALAQQWTKDEAIRVQAAIGGGQISGTVIAAALTSLNGMVQLVENAFAS